MDNLIKAIIVQQLMHIKGTKMDMSARVNRIQMEILKQGLD